MVVLAACRNERGCRCRDSNRSGHCDVDWPVLRSGSQKRSQNHVIGGKRRHVRWCPLRRACPPWLGAQREKNENYKCVERNFA